MRAMWRSPAPGTTGLTSSQAPEVRTVSAIFRFRLTEITVVIAGLAVEKGGMPLRIRPARYLKQNDTFLANQHAAAGSGIFHNLSFAT